MAFERTIDNERLSAMEAARFPGRIVIVDRDELVEEACNDLMRYSVIGFDTETRPSFRAGVSYRVGSCLPQRCATSSVSRTYA